MPGDQGRFTATPLLVVYAKPVPAFRLIGSAGLLRIDDEAVPLFRKKIHPRAGREIVGRLSAAVKHDNQGKPLSLITARDE